MSKFGELRQNAPKLAIKEGAREVIFKTISCMCDNVASYYDLGKTSGGDFKLRWKRICSIKLANET
jgi:hypothetical protein